MRAPSSRPQVDSGPVQVHARQVHFDFADTALHWIPQHPVASDVVGLLNVVLPTLERWFVATFTEALPLVKDTRLVESMRGFIGQEAVHADTHDRALRDFMVDRGLDPRPVLDQVEYVFGNLLAPTSSTDPKRRMSNLCHRLWIIAAIEHYTAVLGDYALNSTWDDYDADPAMADLFRWHGAEEVEHRTVAHDVAAYFHNSYPRRMLAMLMASSMLILFVQRGGWHLVKSDPHVDLGWWRMQYLRYQDSRKGLLPKYRTLFGSATIGYLRPGFSPEEVGSTAQAVAYLASSPAARAAHL